MDRARTGSGSDDGMLSELCDFESAAGVVWIRVEANGDKEWGAAPWCMLQRLLRHS